ncbi:MAG: hypothetical protein ABSB86_16465 [Bryobacteraceae bacterium]|jgi:hypothetical protein
MKILLEKEEDRGNDKEQSPEEGATPLSHYDCRSDYGASGD